MWLSLLACFTKWSLGVCVKVAQLCFCYPMDCSTWNSPGQNTGVGCLSLPQGFFPTQGSNPGLPPCRRILYCLSHQGSPRILQWVAYPFSRDLPDPGIKLGSPALQAILYQLSYQGSPYHGISLVN